MVCLFCKWWGCMTEHDRAMTGLPVEMDGAAPGEEPVELVEVDYGDRAALENRMFDAIKQQRAIALGLTMAGARTRDGIYTAWAYIATTTAGLLVEVLRSHNTEHARELLDTLANEAAATEHNV